MRSDISAGHGAPVDAGRDPTRAAALARLAAVAHPEAATAPSPAAPPPAPPSIATPAEPSSRPSATPIAPWAVPDPDGQRPERIPPDEVDLSAWADPPWWRRIRWAPDRIAGIALVVLVLGLGAFSVHRLLSTVPEVAPVPELPLATPGVTVSADGSAAPAETAPTEASGVVGAAAASPTPAADAEIVVSVVGMVARSGLVTLPPGSRVADALDRAGGVLDGGDRDGLNLARKVEDGEQILVGVAPGPEGPAGPRSAILGPGSDAPNPTGGGAPSAAGAGGSTGSGASGGSGGEPGLVNLNTADVAALDELPGVGPVTAGAILSWRTANGPFANVDQLAEVDGIGPATLAKLRPLVTV